MKKALMMAAAALMMLSSCSQKEERSTADYPEWEYTKIKRQLTNGWNTWDSRSILTQVYAENKTGIRLSMVDEQGVERDQTRIGDMSHDAPRVHPYDHTYDGRYCEADFSWHNIHMKMRCTAQGNRLVMLLTPTEEGNQGCIKVRPGRIWEGIQTSGGANMEEDHFVLRSMMGTELLPGRVRGRNVQFFPGGEQGYYLCQADAPIVISTGQDISAEEAEKLMQQTKQDIEREERQRWGDNYEIHRAMQSVLGWDTVYDPSEDIVVSPVNRNWCMTSSGTSSLTGGYVLFDWDTYFASEMLALDSRELAYCNLIEITRAVDKCGFVPNFTCSNDAASYDRSQPPVGSRAVWEVYRRWGDRWLLELLYPRLLRWNEWWTENRLADGLLCWGSTPRNGMPYQDERYAFQQGLYESGLDNAHVYDNAEFLLDRNILCYNDVGLSALYVMDCRYLALIAQELGLKADARTIKKRGEQFADNLQQLWSEEKGIFLCRDLRNGQLVNEMDPTNFYPMLAQVATKEQARRMVEEHLLNEEEFWGEWVIPCSPRNSKAFQDNNYWRGRIWGPTNYLVYLGLENYDFPEVREQFAEKSRRLLLKDWLVQGYVYENWNATTGQGDDVGSSDRFYHWGALLGYISMMHQK